MGLPNTLKPGETWFKLGKDYLKNKKYKLAEQAFCKSIDNDSREFRHPAEVQLGYAYFGMKEYEKAIPLLEKGDSLDEYKKLAYYFKDIKKNINSAIDYFKLAYKKGYLDGYYEISKIYITKNNYSSACEAMDYVIPYIQSKEASPSKKKEITQKLYLLLEKLIDSSQGDKAINERNKDELVKEASGYDIEYLSWFTKKWRNIKESLSTTHNLVFIGSVIGPGILWLIKKIFSKK